MTAGAWLALAVAFVGMALDLGAVIRGREAQRRFTKPIGLLAISAAAVFVHPAFAAQRSWFVAAFILSLAGDVFLLKASRFVPGLIAFLLSHLCFIVGFFERGMNPSWAMLGALAVSISLVPVAPKLLSAIHEGSEPALLVPVVVYMTVISAMAIAAAGAGPWVALAGAWIFMASDSTLAWNRFVQASRSREIAVMVTYYLAQILLLLGLST